jgi:hypothetical protein
MRALIFDTGNSIIPWLGSLLTRSDFIVDVISTVPKIIPFDGIGQNIYAKNIKQLLNLVVQRSKENYELVVPCSDILLSIIVNADISDDEKLKILPVTSVDNFQHLYSKIELSRTFKRKNIRTPDFDVANTWDELLSKSLKFDNNFFVKTDRGGAGSGVFLISDNSDLIACKSRLNFPLLIQEKIAGNVIDLSGFYQQKKLIHFSYSEMIECRPTNYGPSVVRKYYNDQARAMEFDDLLNRLGDALGANGFVNVSAIEAYNTNIIYFIEADMRPNAWVQHAKYVDDDPAPRISDYFRLGETYNRKVSQRQQINCTAFSKIIPHVDRLTKEEFDANKFNCKSYTL